MSQATACHVGIGTSATLGLPPLAALPTPRLLPLLAPPPARPPQCGKFSRIAYPGFNCVWCCIGEAVAGGLSLRIQQLDVRCETKTKVSRPRLLSWKLLPRGAVAGCSSKARGCSPPGGTSSPSAGSHLLYAPLLEQLGACWGDVVGCSNHPPWLALRRRTMCLWTWWCRCSTRWCARTCTTPSVSAAAAEGAKAGRGMEGGMELGQ